jgi:hypothetical protein
MVKYIDVISGLFCVHIVVYIIEELNEELENSVLFIGTLLGNYALADRSLVTWTWSEKGIVHVCCHIIKRNMP